jgi:hypothetical protein
MHKKFWSDNVRERDQLGKPRCRWENNTKVTVREISVNLIKLTQYRVH